MPKSREDAPYTNYPGILAKPIYRVDFDEALIVEGDVLKEGIQEPELESTEGVGPVEYVTFEEDIVTARPYGVTNPPTTGSELLTEDGLAYRHVTDREKAKEERDFEHLVTLCSADINFAVVQGIRGALYWRDWSEERIKQLMARLRDTGRLSAFITDAVTRNREIREYLLARGMKHEYFFLNYDYGPRDSLEFFTGFVAGVMKSIGETIALPVTLTGALLDSPIPTNYIEALIIITGAPFHAGLNARKEAFFSAMLQILSEFKRTFTLEAAGDWLDRFDALLYELRWFEAGAMLGEVVPDLVDSAAGAVGLLKSGARVGKKGVAGAVSGLKQIGKVTSVDLAKLKTWLSLQEIRSLLKAMKDKTQRWVSADGEFRLISDGQKSLLAKEKTGEHFDLTPLSTEDLNEFDDTFEAALRETPDPDYWVSPLDAEKAYRYHFSALAERISKDLKDIDKLIIDDLKARGKSTKTYKAVVGTKIHSAVGQILEDHYRKVGHKAEIIIDKKLKAVLPPEVHEMTVKEFLEAHGHIFADTAEEIAKSNRKTGIHFEHLAGLPDSVLKAKLGDLEPDLLLIVEDHLFILDLDRVPAVKHIQKTLLYQAIMEAYGGERDIKRVVAGEYYYGEASEVISGPTKKYLKKMERAKKQEKSYYKGYATESQKK